MTSDQAKPATVTADTSPPTPPVCAAPSTDEPADAAFALAPTHDTPLIPVITPPPDGEPPAAADAAFGGETGLVSRRALVTGSAAPDSAAGRSTVPETWKWLWKDTLGRVAPFVVAAGIYARMSGLGWAGIGVRRSTARELGQDLAWGVAIGLPLAGLAAAFRARVAPRYRLPTAADQALQTLFYLAINAPAEELFWRGFVQTMTINSVGRLTRRMGRSGRRAESAAGAPLASAPTEAAPQQEAASGQLAREPGVAAAALGWALTTAIFGAYHRLGGWSWRSIAGVTAAGGVFGAVYLIPRKRRTILPSAIIHGLATAAFLSWGDAALHALSRRRRRARI